eukprot:NODE_4184_length_830_cov_47.976953_g3460_i0.p5 GENE.NODE_4184_length_830_cov_47.976953_g3460_i0~~NODE_4184_length_830_cov_47.976953_g3460_i0.p5  ORF type:complete len:84 (+),score=19.23 NODE_4184_length_830_cov_47.976953_g3460_i0:501-752(+)
MLPTANLSARRHLAALVLHTVARLPLSAPHHLTPAVRRPVVQLPVVQRTVVQLPAVLRLAITMAPATLFCALDQLSEHPHHSL